MEREKLQLWDYSFIFNAYARRGVTDKHINNEKKSLHGFAGN